MKSDRLFTSYEDKTASRYGTRHRKRRGQPVQTQAEREQALRKQETEAAKWQAYRASRPKPAAPPDPEEEREAKLRALRTPFSG